MSTAAPLSPDEHELAVRADADEQVEATVAAADRGLILLGQLRDALEELQPLLEGAFSAIIGVPKYDLECPYDALGKKLAADELGLPESLVALLRPNKQKYLETLAAVDVASAALTRVKRGAYEDRDVAEQEWIAADEALAAVVDAPPAPSASGGAECCASGSCEVCKGEV